MELTNSYMYVVKCIDNTLYTGYTTDLVRRIIKKVLSILEYEYLYRWFIMKNLHQKVKQRKQRVHLKSSLVCKKSNI